MRFIASAFALAPVPVFALACASSEPPPPLPPPTRAASIASAIPPAPVPADAGPTPDAAPAPTAAEAIAAAVAAADRDEADRRLDEGRHPAEILAFLRVAPGEHLAQLVAGDGYFAELLARVVGDSGDVWAENPHEVLDAYAAKPWEARMGKPVMKQVHSAVRRLDDPLPPEAHGLDAVVVALFDHDAAWTRGDRSKAEKAAFDALKPGGSLGLVDATPGAGSRPGTKALIDEATKVGFTLDAEGDPALGKAVALRFTRP